MQVTVYCATKRHRFEPQIDHYWTQTLQKLVHHPKFQRLFTRCGWLGFGRSWCRSVALIEVYQLALKQFKSNRCEESYRAPKLVIIGMAVNFLPMEGLIYFKTMTFKSDIIDRYLHYRVLGYSSQTPIHPMILHPQRIIYHLARLYRHVQ